MVINVRGKGDSIWLLQLQSILYRTILTGAPVLLQIPGFPQLVQADGNSYDTLAKKYPDAAFTMMVMNNLFHHDSEFSEIHQQAFSSIVEGTNISSVRKRYNLCMDAYWQKHLWDD